MFKYSDLLKEIDLLESYGVKTGSIGKTVLGADIPYVYLDGCTNKGCRVEAHKLCVAKPPEGCNRPEAGVKTSIAASAVERVQKTEAFIVENERCSLCGTEKKSIIVTGAIHAREHITALLVLCQIKHILKNKIPLYGGIYFIPMINPDGVRLCQEGADFLDSVPSIGADKLCGLKKELISVNKDVHFGLWKANINCVDLNVNFDADWGRGNRNVFHKSPSDYVGGSPFDQPESRALAEFTLKVNPVSTISYHCKGEEIYWYFGQSGDLLWKSYRLAKMLARETNYKLVDGKGSAGGYKDYCIQKLGIHSFTIEVGADKYRHPFPYSQFESILRLNKNVPHKLINTLVSYKGKRPTLSM